MDVLSDAGLDVLPRSGPTYGSIFGDYNLDGWPDLLVGRHKRHPRFFQNESGSFSVASIPGLQDPAPGRKIYDLHACSWGEATGDSLPDLYCVSGAQDGAGTGPNRLFVQVPSKRELSKRTPDSLEDLLGRGRSLNWFDADGDGDLDLFVANEIRERVPSRLFRKSEGVFEAEVDSPLAASFPTRSSSWADWNNDGDPDLMILGHGYRATRAFEGQADAGFQEIDIPGITGEEWLSAAFGDFDNDGWSDVVLVAEERAVLFRNERGVLKREVRFPDVRAGRMAAWVDVDNDGLLDVFVVQGARGDPPAPGTRNLPNLLFSQKGASFEKVEDAGIAGPEHGNGESVAVADYDRDGRMDLFVSHGYLDIAGPFELLRNRTMSRNKYLMVHLRGPDGNPLGYGSRLVVTTDERTIRRQMTDGFSFRTQSSPGVVHFGVGQAESVTIKVIWPDGSRSCLDSSTNRSLIVAARPHHSCPNAN